MLDEAEYARWMSMADSTIRSAEGDLLRGDYNWACFKAQQSTEFAVKALLYGLGMAVHRNSVSRLLSSLPEELDYSAIMQAAKTLDKYYVPTRYPNAWTEGAPFEYYTERDAREAISYAREVIEWVREAWRSLGGGRRIGGP